MNEFCPPNHEHDALCDPKFYIPRVSPNADPTPEAHKRFMEEFKQDGWLSWQLTRPIGSQPASGKHSLAVKTKPSKNPKRR